jgi:hypothetical protein
VIALPKVPALEVISNRLPIIFPEGTEHRNYLVRDVAAKTIYVMFYVGAVESFGGWLRPSQVTDMSDQQAEMLNQEDRLTWIKKSLSSKKNRPQQCWYATNSREQIRDETIRTGLIPCRAIIERSGLPTTSSHPKYALSDGFAKLFDVSLTEQEFAKSVEDWQSKYLNKAALSRLKIIKAGSEASAHAISVIFPNGTKRLLSSGLSSVIAKSVIEVFAPMFLTNPTVLWLSESGKKVVTQDDELAKALGLNIDPQKALPDMILVDLGNAEDGSELLVLFIEIVATDGPINRERKAVLTSLALDAGFDVESIAFLSAFSDRDSQPFRKAISNLAWGSYAWFESEPEHIVYLRDGKPAKLMKF